ncbi:uncharacterized protein LOC135844990 [Planococcus citri]|uniref:uncharacterized protein LOC135844990 n=1 Tax=Planococcus citri TaxID=170843 RepID=UPI0031F72360
MPVCRDVLKNFSNRIDDLETEISRRELEMCPLEAKVFYDDLLSIYKKIIEYEKEMIDDDESQLYNLLEDNRKVHLKTTHLKIKLTKIISSTRSTPLTEAKVEPTDTERNLEPLFKKSKSLIARISLLKPKEDLCPEQAEITQDHLKSLYESFDSNQIEIESQVSGTALDRQLELSKQIQNKVIEFQTTLKKISNSIKPLSMTQMQALQSEQVKSPESEISSSLRSIELKLSNLTDFLESRSSRDETESNINDIYTNVEDNLEISKDIQNKMISLQTTLSKFVDDANQHREKTIPNEKNNTSRINRKIYCHYCGGSSDSGDGCCLWCY